MPILTVDRLQTRETTIKKTLGEKADQLDPGRKRRLAKNLRRNQRKRRKIAAQAERLKPKAEAKADE